MLPNPLLSFLLYVVWVFFEVLQGFPHTWVVISLFWLFSSSYMFLFFLHKNFSITDVLKYGLLLFRLSVVSDSASPWTVACQAFLSITNSQSSPKITSIESVMPSNYLILSPASPPVLNLSQHQSLFKWVSSSHQVAKVLESQLQHQSFQWTSRTDLL